MLRVITGIMIIIVVGLVLGPLYHRGNARDPEFNSRWLDPPLVPSSSDCLCIITSGIRLVCSPLPLVGV
jgi:hypothetical protein